LGTISGKRAKPASANNASISRFVKKKSQYVRIRISNVSKMPLDTFLFPVKVVSIITQVIIEIRALPLAENGVIFRYNHLRGRLALCGCA